ncbi:DUF1270 family protein [Staphylococcus epidermidis]|uniref:DUF1270 family protein n=1 Tax=Staphylococcus epidermidis TaxID=1282 RepID=UPI0021A41626|nr:DUF1270 family protein [Staphylococcus epidermidis]MCT2095291.1 DUF1270 family protein [Staphylococcus epidermidis]MCT2125677.1 DUF1270 family protein [Staphylococcus epidermidis]MCT2210877.1 DUF1270 family protein [Staphylococcus epidermidis]
MSKSFISFVIANLVFVTMSILLALIGLYFTTPIGTAALLSIITFLLYDNYFFQEIKKTVKHGNA